MPRALPALTAVALALVLVGCAPSDPDPDASGGTGQPDRECTAAGAVSDSVSVAGEFGEAPSVDFDAPLSLDQTQRTVVSGGDGDPVPFPSVVGIDYTFYNGRSGEVVESTEYADGAEAVFVLGESQLLSGLRKTIECSPVGARIVSVVPAVDGFGDQGLVDFGIEAGDPLVFVVDVVSAVDRATGEAQDAPEGFPGVELNADGRPAIALAGDEASSSETRSAVLVQGEGREVQAADTVYIQYQGVDAETGEIFDETWGGSPYRGSASGFIPGFTDSLVGQRVGSQFIVVIPPKDGYGEASDANTHALAGRTLVFVVDVLQAVAPV